MQSKGNLKRMNLKNITLILIISMFSSFSIRIIGTLLPAIFIKAAIVYIAITINTFFSLVQLLFFLYFLNEYASTVNPALKTISLWPILGSLLIVFLYIKNFSSVFRLHFIPFALTSPVLDALFPLISSCYNLLFFSVFRKRLLPKESQSLRTPLNSAIAGVVIFLGLHLLVLINYLFSGKFLWLEHFSRGIAVGTLPIIVVAFLCLVYFYINFYQYLKTLQA